MSELLPDTGPVHQEPEIATPPIKIGPRRGVLAEIQRYVLSALGWWWVATCAFGTLLTGVLSLPLRPDSTWFTRVACLVFGRCTFLLNPMWTLRIEGREHLPQDGPFILCPNHASQLDVPAMLAVNEPARFVVADWVRKVPTFGWYLSRMGTIWVQTEAGRPDVASGAQALRQALDWLEEGGSLCIFPEGTRTHDGDVGELLPGAFALARRAKVDIVPVVIEGTYDIMSRHDWRYSKRAWGSVTVRILPRMRLPERRIPLRQARNELTRTLQTELARLRAGLPPSHQPLEDG